MSLKDEQEKSDGVEGDEIDDDDEGISDVVDFGGGVLRILVFDHDDGHIDRESEVYWNKETFFSNGFLISVENWGFF